MIKVKYRIEGVCPILFHNVYSMDLVKPKKFTHAEWEDSKEVFDSRLYLEDGKLTLPPRMLLGLLKNAASKCGMKQDGKRSGYKDVIKACVFCIDPCFLDQKIEDLEKHKDYVKMPSTKARVQRIFPMLRKWSGIFEFTIDESQISLEVVDELMLYGGSYCGFGDYHPQFGRFTATRIK